MYKRDFFLYVENDLYSRQVLEIIVRQMMEYAQIVTFDSSENFQERLDALSRPPSVIFLDMQVQPLNGFEMLKLLRADPVYQNVKIVAVTAHVMRDEVDHMRAAGFDGLIAKPIPHKLFPELVQKILTGQQIWHVS
jgi:CheY-like chemotaxis protein